MITLVEAVLALLVLITATCELIILETDLVGLSGAKYKVRYGRTGWTRAEAAQECTLALRNHREIADFLSVSVHLESTNPQVPMCWTGLEPPTAIRGSLDSGYTLLEFVAEDTSSMLNYLLCQSVSGQFLDYSDCPQHFSPGLSPNRCFQYNSPSGYFEAKHTCLVNGGKLFEPRSANDIYDLMAVHPDSAQLSHYWIGLRIQARTRVWESDQEPLNASDSLVWPLRETIDVYAASQCLAVVTELAAGHKITLGQFPCDSVRPFYCTFTMKNIKPKAERLDDEL